MILPPYKHTGDWSEIFIEYLAVLQYGEALQVPYAEYRIDKPLALPVPLNCGITGVGGLPTLDFSNCEGTAITMTTRGSHLSSLILKSNGGNHAVKVGGTATSNNGLQRLIINGFDDGLTFDDAHDSAVIDNIQLYGNKRSMVMENELCTSLKFERVQSLRSQQDLVIKTQITDCRWLNGTFNAMPDEAGGTMVDIEGAVFKAEFKGNRFEARDDNGGGDLTCLRIKGASDTYPAQNISIDDNYLTGSVKRYVEYVSNVRCGGFTNNHLQETPSDCDIKINEVSCTDIATNGNTTLHKDYRAILT